MWTWAGIFKAALSIQNAYIIIIPKGPFWLFENFNDENYVEAYTLHKCYFQRIDWVKITKQKQYYVFGHPGAQNLIIIVQSHIKVGSWLVLSMLVLQVNYKGILLLY